MSTTNGHNNSPLQRLQRAQAAGELSAAALADPATWPAFGLSTIDLAFMQECKAEVDQLVRTDPRAALSVAELAAALAPQANSAEARALGVRAHAMALYVLTRYPEAITQFERARQLYQEANLPVEAARVERALVDALSYRGRYDEAFALAAQARQTLRAHDEKLLLAQLETNVGNLYVRLDRNQEALVCYDAAAAVFKAIEHRHGMALVAANQATAYCNLDDFQQAQTLYEQAIAIQETDDNQIGAAQSRYSLSYLYFLRGAYHQAMRSLHETRSECLRLGDQQTAALCLLDLAEIYLQLNVLPEAAHLAEQAREQFVKLEMRYETARSLTFLGLALLRQTKLAEAATAFAEARTAFDAEGNAVQIGLLDLYEAELRLLHGQPDEAWRLAHAAETQFHAAALTAKTCCAQLLQARALWAGASVNPTDAISAKRSISPRQLCEQIIAACAELETPWLQAQAHELLGDILLAASAPALAQQQYAAAVGLIEQIRSAIRVDEFRIAFFRDKLGVYEKLISLCLAESDPARQAEAFYYLESAKARTLVDLLVNEFALLPPPDDAASAALHQQWQELRERLHWYQNKIQQRESGPEQSRRLTTDEHWRHEIADCERALTELTCQLQATDPHFQWLENTGGMQLVELRMLLADDEIVIEYYLTDETLKIFVIDRDGLTIVDSPATRTQIADAVQKLRFQFDKFRYGQDYMQSRAARLRHHADACLHELWQALFAPIAARAAGKQLIFVPFDFLHNVPFQALYDGAHYLIEAHEITLAPSARLLQLCAARAPQRYESAVLFGAADALAPNILAEIQKISALFPASKCFEGAAATTEALRTQAGNSDILHIASHAVFRKDNPMFSAFRLADGWLNFYDICSLRLPASLVTLSGCHTGASRIYDGDELTGLARGFLSAGAAALVVSLWAVNDPATAALMTEFYQSLQHGAAPRAALRQAALAIKTQYAHPYYWAPFVLISHH